MHTVPESSEFKPNYDSFIMFLKQNMQEKLKQVFTELRSTHFFVYRWDFFWKTNKRIGLNKRIGRKFFQKRIKV